MKSSPIKIPLRNPLPRTNRLARHRPRLVNERMIVNYLRFSLAMVSFGLAVLPTKPVRTGRAGQPSWRRATQCSSDTFGCGCGAET